MITQEQVKQIVENALEGTTAFIVDVVVKPGNAIMIILDDDAGINIDFCVTISRKIEENLDRDVEDYSLEVSSAGIGNPFKVPRQYQKAIGKNIEIVLKDGQKFIGTLMTVAQDGIFISLEKSNKKGKNKTKTPEQDDQNPKFIPMESIKQTKEIVKFK
ncbi:MAG TPA: ribosome assembly cofactor RimP [Salinivirgaceae bacterium]|nr:ribosome assembly cofactor RimP [Salinivirgaceae bacterium]